MLKKYGMINIGTAFIFMLLAAYIVTKARSVYSKEVVTVFSQDTLKKTIVVDAGHVWLCITKLLIIYII